MQDQSIGNSIYMLRTVRRMSFRELAEASGVSASYIFQIEQDAKLPSPMILRKLAAGLDTSFTDLMKVAGHLQEGDIQQ